MTQHKAVPPVHLPFDETFRDTFRDLVLWRRDVRRFRSDPVPEKLIDDLIELATHAPSVGFSQPWRFVKVKSPERRRAVWENFAKANERAREGYDGDQKKNYMGLKLAGLKEAPVHLAIFSDESTITGSGLGRQTMPETLRYSVVGAVQTMWLGARAEGLGMGWVSIFDPAEVTRALDVPEGWKLVAYLDLGWPAEEHIDPELERHHWEDRHYTGDLVFDR
jgi:5,6-dimethylbenzimidazole synthase